MNFSKIVISLAIALGFMAVPALALAHESEGQADVDVSSSIGISHPNIATGVLFGGNGTAIANGATVDTVGSTSVTAHSSIGSTILNWILNTSSSTKIKAGGTTSNSTAGVKSGDTISFVGMLNSFGSTLTVSLEALRDWAKPATTTATTTVSHKGNDKSDNGKHLGWFKNWFHFGASAHVNAHTGDN